MEEGIMLPASPLIKFLIKAALVRAFKHHPLEINHFIVNGTHIHMIVRIDNSEDLPKFMERFKTESAHYLNRISLVEPKELSGARGMILLPY